MVIVKLFDNNTDGITNALRVIATDQPLGSVENPDMEAYYQVGGFASYVDVQGTGFTYDAVGMLVGGTITSINDQVYGPKDDPNVLSTDVDYTGLSLPVSEAIELASRPNEAPEFYLLSNGSTIYSNTGAVTSPQSSKC